MTTPSRPMVKGWCPGALRPMRSGDGMLVRIRPPCGRLTQAQAAGVALLSTRYGNGLLDLSTRANLQLRGVNEEGWPRLLDGLAELGLLDPTPEAEARRSLVVAPFWRDGDDTMELASRLSNALRDEEGLSLPGKFGFAMDAGEQPVLRNVSADIRIERDESGELLCRADGASHGARVTAATMADAALALARWFVASGGAGRMAAHIASGATPPPMFSEVAATMERPATRPAPGPAAAGFTVALTFGQMEAATLSALAATAPLRVTPWRMVLLEGVTTAPEIDGVITCADDLLLRVVACVGAPGCAQALQPTRPLARALAPRIAPGETLHVSGCAKGCAHPAAASVTLVAQIDGFGLVRNGDASSPVERSLTSRQLQAAPETLTRGADAIFL
ncbi:precorrin-3B synthase [Acetobacter nitrogenifigens]|nr:precorrin-3B synthase [Acetobacter nitrogenifigens]